MSATPATDLEGQLIDDIGAFYADPLGYVRYSFPWGEAGTPFADEDGPDTWQVDILQTLGHEIRKGVKAHEALQTAIQLAVASGHGIGKQLTFDTRVPTPDGERQWGDLKVGDFVFGADGAPTRVKACHYPGVKPFYRIVFDDGSEVKACGEHQWSVRGRKERRNCRPHYRTMTTDDIRDAGVKRRNGGSWARQWEVPVQGAAQFQPREVSLHPYFVGIWLGDGSKGEPSYCKPNPEIRDRVRSVCGYEVRTQANGKQQRAIGIKQSMADPVFGLGSHQRYIPDDYKFNSIESRLELFRGLCDSDGEVHASGSIGYSTTSRQLADDVVWLARSLGYKAMMQPTVKRSWYRDGSGDRKTCRDAYRVTINCPENPFTHAARRAAYKPSEQRYLVRWIDRIEPIGEREGMCITVAADDELYLANDFIVTHNSALVAWLVLWFMSTRPDCQIVVTANTATQLTTKTWREVAKWHRHAINAHWFKWTATRFYAVSSPSTWFASAIPWSENNPEAFAGTHEKEVLIIFDEASRVADIIWETASGALTTSGAIWIAFGNPTRNTGRFKEAFGKLRHRWITRQIDSRDAKMANRAQLQQWVDDYGEDSDYVRVRVRGQFPRVGDVQLIGSDVVEAAMERTLEPAVFAHFPKMLGVDVARFGDDMSVIYRRQGPMLWEPRSFNRIDTMQLAAHVLDEAREFGTKLVFVDGVGVGGGVVDRLREVGLDVVDVQSGEAATDRKRFKNRRMEIWWRMKEWLDGDVSIPAGGNQLRDDLIAPEYGFDASLRMQLEAVESMKDRGLASPDYASALAMTFADFSGGHRRAKAKQVRRVRWA